MEGILRARSLRKAPVPAALFSDPSPANIQATRLALHVNEDETACSVYIASGCQVYKMEISMEESMVSRGKESLLIPVNAKVIEASELDRCPHRSEIQSIVLTQGDENSLILGSVDSYGHLIISRLDTDFDRISYSVLPLDIGIGEGSWAGLTFSPINQSTVAVARSFCKSIDVYDQDIPIRSFSTLWYPNSLSFVGDGSSSLLSIAEGSQLSMWDLRSSNNGGCIKRISNSIGDIIYSVCGSNNYIAIAGSDRTLSVFDSRRWSAVSRWINCSKYEITGLEFSSIDPSFIYIQGVDYEVTCGKWKEREKAFSFRGDSNWLGFSKCADKDVVAGWCESGNIFVADVGMD